MAIGPLTPVIDVDYKTAGIASATSLTVNKPSGVANNDVLFAVIHAATNAGDMTPPSGWVLIFAFTTRKGGLYYKLIPSASGETATSYTWSSTGGVGRWAGILWRLSGVDATHVIDAVSAAETAGTSGAVTVPGITTLTDDALLCLVPFANPGSSNSGATFTFPSGTPEKMHVDIGSGTAGTAVAVGFEVRADAGPTGTRVVSGIGTPNGGNATPVGIMFAIRQGSIAPEPPIGIPVKNGEGETVYLSYLNGAGTRVAPASARIWLPGFDDVAVMLAKPGATWAHRGGSVDWPEMSEYAYDQSVLRGYGVLEFSCARTSDGVWFGVHDSDINRTSQTTGLPNASAMTWAQVQEHMITLNDSGTPRPYYKLVDFVEKYGPTHVLVLDPKSGLGSNTDFLAQISATGVDKSRLIWKYYGVGASTATAAGAALADGWGGTWGYFYDTDVTSGAFATDAVRPQWTMIGMNIGAAQSFWDTAVAVGKPVVGHIAATQAAYDQAITKGADLVQCSGVAAIAPVSSWQG